MVKNLRLYTYTTLGLLQTVTLFTHFFSFSTRYFFGSTVVFWYIFRDLGFLEAGGRAVLDGNSYHRIDVDSSLSAVDCI